MLQNVCTFKKTTEQSFLKSRMSLDSRSLIYAVKCSACKEEYIGETEIGQSRLRDRVRIHEQHFHQPQHEKLKTTYGPAVK